IAQERGCAAALVGVVHRSDIDRIEERVMADGAQRLQLRTVAAKALGEGHEMHDPELEVRLPGLFHAGKSKSFVRKGEWKVVSTFRAILHNGSSGRIRRERSPGGRRTVSRHGAGE